MTTRPTKERPSNIEGYLREIETAIKANNATEHTHRPALKRLIESYREGVIATNEPQRIKCGAPDYIVTFKNTPLGYIEAKDVGVDLNRAEDSEQLKRYRSTLRNLILTDYLEFRMYRNGEKVQTVKVGQILKNGSLRKDQEGLEQFGRLITAFLDADVPTIGSPKELAQRMATLARLLHDLIRNVFSSEGAAGDLHAQYDAFRRILIGDLSVDQFSDMYAQTIAYGLFAARCNHDGPGFSREHAAHELPKTNPFLRRLFNSIAGADLDDRISWAVDDLTALLAKADMPEILRNFGTETGQHDPVVHFYETFLAAYDPKLRETRGVYYTPEPVVSYIVRSVDQLLKSNFGLADGLANSGKIKLKRKKLKGKGEEDYETHKVQILDPACGTGTFLHSVVSLIGSNFTGNAGMWPSYVENHLLPRLYGFELLMAPYAVAHMKLGLQLKESGYDFRSDERLRVFLTNTLEKAHELTGLPLFSQWLAEEAASASDIKNNAPIMVVLGNPPYSGHSANMGEWITGLLDEYKVSPELKKPAQAKWLSDDYVKFVRFSQWRIEMTGYGILAFVTNHSYLDNPTFLDMRRSLMDTFNEIYLLDLHGSAKKVQLSESGEKDENVFDIQQGVAIALFVKHKASNDTCIVKRADLRGLRANKYDWLNSHDVRDTPWEEITPGSAPWLFVKQDADRLAEYQRGWSVSDIFSPNGDPSIGVVTTHDDFAVSWSKDEAVRKVEKLLGTNTESEARELFKLCSQSQWSYDRAKRELANGKWRSQVVPMLYRPFDVRWTVWDANVAVHRRERVMRNMIGGGNIALITDRQVNGEFSHVLATDEIINDCALSTQTKERSYLFPLYLQERSSAGSSPSLFGEDKRRANLSQEFLEAFAKAIGRPDSLAEDIFGYIYAILYSRSYRERYNEFLKRDFPRVPLPRDEKMFKSLSSVGKKLVDLHLLKDAVNPTVGFPNVGSNYVEYVKYEDGKGGLGKVWINPEQYFEQVPSDVWNYSLGAYKVPYKWLRDRKGRALSFDELKKYIQIISILGATIELQGKIDAILI